MVGGRILKFAGEEYDGDVQYNVVYPNLRIGGLMPTRKTIPLSLIHPLRNKLERALLEIGVITESRKIDWRVKVNGISITKEFRPHATCSAGRNLYAKLIYDVTSILKTPESLRKRRVNVTFKTEGGSEIQIEQIGLLVMFPSKEASSRFIFLSGALSLKPGESSDLEFRYPGDKGVLKAIVYMPSPEARGSIVVNDKAIPVEGLSGIDEVHAELDGLKGNNIIRVNHEDTGITYYPREMRVSTILVSHIVYREPALEVRDIMVPSEISGKGEITAVVVNNGESSPDSLMAVLMLPGKIISRRELKPVEPGNEEAVSIPVDLPKGEYELTLRLIWRKLSRSRYIDRKFSVRIA